MAVYDFDTIVGRRGTNSLKYDFAVERGRPADVLPLWVADMDFRAPDVVLEALRKAVEHGIFGYSEVKGEYADAVIGWFAERFGWTPRPEWLVKTPGVVYALALAVRAFTEPGDGVLIQPPVYYPFFSVVTDNGRRLAESPLAYENGHYAIDFADFERKIVQNHVKLFLLCSPHNPVCRVWTREELQTLGAICERHGVFVVSDEIHCDFTYPGHPHTVFLQACPALAERAAICTAGSKSFNIAGLQVSNIFLPGAAARKAFAKELDRSGYSQFNTLGLVATQAAYAGGGEWLDACKAYIRGNLDCLRAFLSDRLPEIKLVAPEGTYFAWLDCSGLGMERRELDDFMVGKARLWLDAGHIFGGGADRFQRLVLACPRATLKQALGRLEQAVRAAEA